MLAVASSLDEMVTAMVPSLSRSLAEQFNVLRVMHHGTHEKQLSNVFAWLLRADGTHELGDAFQRIFVEHVNRQLPTSEQLPGGEYRVMQEVDTSGHEDLSRDIADIVLTSDHASLVVENYESSDGHGHGYDRYLAHGAMGGRQSVVVRSPLEFPSDRRLGEGGSRDVCRVARQPASARSWRWGLAT